MAKVGSRMTPSQTKLGRFIRGRRLKLGISQKAVARIAGMSQANHSHYEIGQSRYLPPKFLRGLAEALKVDASTLRVLVPQPKECKPKSDFGKFIRRRRKELGLTITQAAKQAGKSREWFYHIEKNATFVRKTVMPLLAKALACDESFLYRFRLDDIRQNETRFPLGNFIRSRRNEMGLSQRELATKVGVSTQYISMIEVKRVVLSNETLVVKLARALQLDASLIQRLRPKRAIKQPAPGKTALGNLLAKKRFKLGLSRREIAQGTGVSESYYRAIERGDIKNPKQGILEKLERFLSRQIPKAVACQLSPSQ